ncbi:hypothetical protein GCM10027613_19090 [Microlunatus endophyticus]
MPADDHLGSADGEGAVGGVSAHEAGADEQAQPATMSFIWAEIDQQLEENTQGERTGDIDNKNSERKDI